MTGPAVARSELEERPPRRVAWMFVPAVAFALWWSGFIPAFGRNRGLLQVTVAIPGTCVLAGFGAHRWTELGTRVLAMAPVPLLVVTLAVGLAFDVETAALPALAALAGTAGVPWLAGVAAGSWRNRRRAHRLQW